MKNTNFVILCLRLMGIYFIIQGIAAYPNIAFYFVETNKSNVPFFIYLTPNIYLVFGLILFFAAPKLSKLIISYDEAEDRNISITPTEKTARIALLILGIYILVTVIPQFFRVSIDVAIYYSNLEKIAKELREAQPKWAYLIGPLLQLFIAAILIIGPSKIVSALAKYDKTFKRIESSNKSLE